MDDKVDVDSLTLDFVNAIRLVDIDVTQISFTMKLEADEEYSPNDVDLDPTFDVAVDLNDQVNRARFRVKLSLEFPGTADLLVELGAVYDLGDQKIDDLPENVIPNFFGKVVLMTLFPYLRSEVSHLTSQAFKNPLVLPILEQGDVVFN